MILAIDPGTTESAFVYLDPSEPKLYGFGKTGNDELREVLLLRCEQVSFVVIEAIKSYGMPMGDTTIETCVWIGRFIERWVHHVPDVPVVTIPRKTVVTELCRSPRANDSNVRAAVLDWFRERTNERGGGRESMIGTAKCPGPLFGVAGDVWSALAIAIATFEIGQREIENALR